MTSPMDEALRRTNEAVERYQVPQRLIGVATQSLEQMADGVRHQSELYALVDSVQWLAGSHDGPHPECLTCHALKNTLAVSMAAVRAETDIALTALMDE
jgi:hypothetical protein